MGDAVLIAKVLFNKQKYDDSSIVYKLINKMLVLVVIFLRYSHINTQTLHGLKTRSLLTIYNK